MPREFSTAEAAQRVGVTAQTIRQWCESGRLNGRRIGNRRVWRVDAESVRSIAAARGVKEDTVSPDVEAELRLLRESLARLEARDDNAAGLLAAIERERDRYRADSAALREAALRVNAAARETYQAVRHLLVILEEQSGALEQLLAPASPLDLLTD